MNIPKRLYPHIYEFQRLGKDETPEGREYIKQHQNKIDREYSDVLDAKLLRYLHGNDKIHKITEYEKNN